MCNWGFSIVWCCAAGDDGHTQGSRRAAAQLSRSHERFCKYQTAKKTRKKNMFVTLLAALFPIYSEFLDYSLPTFPLGEFLMVEACV